MRATRAIWSSAVGMANARNAQFGLAGADRAGAAPRIWLDRMAGGLEIARKAAPLENRHLSVTWRVSGKIGAASDSSAPQDTQPPGARARARSGRIATRGGARPHGIGAIHRIQTLIVAGTSRRPLRHKSGGFGWLCR